MNERVSYDVAVYYIDWKDAVQVRAVTYPGISTAQIKYSTTEKDRTKT